MCPCPCFQKKNSGETVKLSLYHLLMQVFSVFPRGFKDHLIQRPRTGNQMQKCVATNVVLRKNEQLAESSWFANKCICWPLREGKVPKIPP